MVKTAKNFLKIESLNLLGIIAIIILITLMAVR